MTRSEAEEIFITAVKGGKSTAVEMTANETQVFRVLVGRVIKEMEKKNRSLWYKAREFGVEWRKPFCVIRKLNSDRYKMWTIEDDGTLTSIVKEGIEEKQNEVTVCK
jgi:hypothetical protein